MNRHLLDYMPELEAFAAEAFERSALSASGAAMPLGAITEMELAAATLEAGPTARLDTLLDRLAQRRGPPPGALPPPLRRALHRVACRVLTPRAPGALKRVAREVFDLELEGLSPEDKEFETARRFVRFAAAAIDQARQPGTGAQAALARAARLHAPGLLFRQGDRPDFFNRS